MLNPYVLRLIGWRLLMGALTLLAVSAIIFFTISLLPGDYASQVLGQAATPQAVANIRRQLGLDQPLLTRYVGWLTGFLTGDLGHSYASTDNHLLSVSSMLSSRLLNTLLLAGATALIAVPLAVGLGIYSAMARGGIGERLINVLTLGSISMPEFLLAYLLMLLLSVELGWLPTLANISRDMSPAELAQRCALPVLTLTLAILAHMLRMTRSAIVGVLNQPYVEMARCKGLSQRRIIFHHALPNSWAPIVNVIAFNLSYLVVGVVVVETVFSYPGIGQTMVDAVRARDLPVVQACALIFALTYIVLNLTADLISICTNPRLLCPR